MSLSHLHDDLKALKVRHTGFAWMMYYTITIPGFHAVFLFRFSSFFYRQGAWAKPLARFVWQLNLLIHHCDIAPESDIGGGLFLPHPLGIVIGKKVRIGERVTLYQNTTIGLRHSRDALSEDDYPTLGNDVLVTAGAVIAGNIHIGDHSVIGANAVVLNDVPAGATAVGIPARIIYRP